MTEESDTKPRISRIQELYPELSAEQAVEAEANMRRYAAVVLRIYKRLRACNFQDERFQRLTALLEDAKASARKKVKRDGR